MSPRPVRRVVTGHNAQGQAVIQSDAPADRVFDKLGPEGLVFHELWNTRETPARIDAASGQPQEDRLALSPPSHGTRIRIVDLPPDDPDVDAEAVFDRISASDSYKGAGSDRHAAFHRTQTVDYGIVLEGELVLIMDVGETTVRAGDVIIQRGTNHAWANRTGKTCRIAFILIDGQFADGLS